MAYRDEWCGDVREQSVGRRVQVAGWVHRRRDHGGLIFVDLRDRTGLLQLVVSAEETPDVHERAEELRNEYVLSAAGTVVARSPERVNPNLATGRGGAGGRELDHPGCGRDPALPCPRTIWRSTRRCG